MQACEWRLQGRAQMYDTVTGIGVDPRNIAQRIMDVRRLPASSHLGFRGHVGS